MPSITREELKEKYPRVYYVFKCAEDFNNSPDTLVKEMEFILSELERDESPTMKKEMAIRQAIINGVIKVSLQQVKQAIKKYEHLDKLYEQSEKTENT